MSARQVIVVYAVEITDAVQVSVKLSDRMGFRSGTIDALARRRPTLIRRMSSDTDQARRQLLEEGHHVAPLGLLAEDGIALRIDAVTGKAEFAMSRSIVVIVCMDSSSESWGTQWHPHPWHSRAGGGAVRSINCRRSLALPRRRFSLCTNPDKGLDK
jgi:hypothetical protein